MSYAPTLMRQQHDDAIAKQMELAEALKFDYLKQDAEGLEPILQKYNTDIEDVSKQIAQQGFSQDIKNKVLGLRSKYVGDDKIRKYKKNYAEAMSGWEELKKRKIQEGVPSQFLSKAKDAYFGSYSGAFDSDGFYNEFTPGRVSNYYDITEDAKKAMTNIGKTGSIVGSSGSSVNVVDDPKVGKYFKVFDSTTGQYITTKDQIEATKAYLRAEYNPENKVSDRGLFSKIAGYTQEDIGSLVNQVGKSMLDSYYQSLPQERSNYSGLGKDDESNGSPLLTYEALKVDSKQYKEADEREKIIKGEITGRKTSVRPEIEGVDAFVDAENPFLTTSRKIKTPEETIIEQNKRTPRYLKIINPETGKIYTPKEAAIAGARAEKNASAYRQTSTAMNIDSRSLSGMTPAEVVLNNMINSSSKTPITNVDKDEKMSKQDFINMIETDENKGISWKDMPVKLDGDGNIILNDFNGNTFRVNTRGENSEGVMEKSTGQLYREIYLPIIERVTSFNLFDDPALDKPVVAPDGSIYDVVTYGDQDPYNVGNRLIRKTSLDQNGSTKEEIMTPEQFKQGFLMSTALGLKNIQIK